MRLVDLVRYPLMVLIKSAVFVASKPKEAAKDIDADPAEDTRCACPVAWSHARTPPPRVDARCVRFRNVLCIRQSETSTPPAFLLCRRRCEVERARSRTPVVISLNERVILLVLKDARGRGRGAVNSTLCRLPREVDGRQSAGAGSVPGLRGSTPLGFRYRPSSAAVYAVPSRTSRRVTSAKRSKA